MPLPRSPLLIACLALCAATSALASERYSVPRMSMELARDLAQQAVDACRSRGYNVSAVVVDRDGNLQVVLRDSRASRFTVELARRKANAVTLAGVSGSEFRRARQDIRPEINSVSELLMLEGAVPIRAGGVLLGALGVSGAPGGDKDEICAADAVTALQDRLEFAD
ncbi:GlcG/HbpS family heme-binding protein [Thiobacter aerophilum]|uniref:Heme-binding protein n=1 Tax=Thiobacter aerophilum TaxID=3121275 RepID=A0ABV0EFQ8_9BURK